MGVTMQYTTDIIPTLTQPKRLRGWGLVFGGKVEMKRLFVFISVLSIIRITATDSYGEQYWAKTYGGTGNDYAYSIQKTSDGEFIIGGSTRSFGARRQDIWVFKLDTNGDIAWQKTYGEGDYYYVHSIHQTLDGGYVIASTPDFWVLKLDSNGNVTWQKKYGGAIDITINSIRQTLDSGYIVAGTRSGNVWVLKLDSEGEVIWQRDRTSSSS